MRTERGRDEARGARPATAEVGRLVERLRELGRRRLAGAAANEPPPEGDTAHRIDILEERVAHLEALLEGLQDAVDRQAVLQGGQITALLKRTEPGEMARAISEDARKRGF